MLSQVLPKIEVLANTMNYGQFSIGPMVRGYGTTVGIALRRVLLSSLTGAAITSVRIDGVPHEFTTIPGAKEDMMIFMLNLKKVRLVLHTEEEQVRMHVSAHGKSIITAGDIEAPSEAEIVNPELQLLTLDTVDSDLEIELIAERGVGYSPAEDRKQLPIGQIPVDAIFSPVIKVSNSIEPARIDQDTHYDLLKLEIWTDGTQRPGIALSQAAAILLKHFEPVVSFISSPTATHISPEVFKSALPYVDVPIEELELSMRAFNCLKRAGVEKIGDVIARLEHGLDELLAIRNFGQKSLNELIDSMKQKGYLTEDFPLPE
ncbi:MAG: DNA-directed RNA polymerase subunit alpha [Anaerolineae bacterium]